MIRSVRQTRAFLGVLDYHGIIRKAARETKGRRRVSNDGDLVRRLTPPGRYLRTLLPEIREGRDPAFTRRQERQILRHDVIQHQSSQSLFHRVPDDRLLDIMREGRFRPLTENPKGALSTNWFEVTLGLTGLFCAYGHEYQCQPHADTMVENTVVLPASLIDEPDSLFYRGEFSFSYLFGEDSFAHEVLADGPSKVLSRGIYRAMRDYAQAYGVETSDYRAFMYILCGFVEMMRLLLTPEEVRLSAVMPYYLEAEVVVNPKRIQAPQMIIVSEEPEFFMDEAARADSRFRDVPFVTDEATRRAEPTIEEKLAGKDILAAPSGMWAEKEQDRARRRFVLAINKGWLNLDEWSVSAS